MKTEVIIKRPFLGGQISQKSKSGMFNATELVKIANTKRKELNKPIFNLAQWLKQKNTIEFIEELQKDNETVYTMSRGRNSATWMHPLLFIDLCLSINPKFKIEVYQWVFDELLKYRNISGDSYRKMAGSLYDRTTSKTTFHKEITEVANQIKIALQVKDWNTASQEQLQLRDKIHENIYLLCNALKDIKQAVRLGIDLTLKKD